MLTEAGLKIAPSTYYAALTRRPSARAIRDEELMAMIDDIWLFDFRRAPSGSSLTIGGCAGCSATVLGVGSCPGF